MLAARVGELDGERTDFGLVKCLQQRFEADVEDVRAFPVAPADMQPDAVARQSLDRLVDRSDVQLRKLDEFGVSFVLEQKNAFHGQVGCIELQNIAGIDN